MYISFIFILLETICKFETTQNKSNKKNTLHPIASQICRQKMSRTDHIAEKTANLITDEGYLLSLPLLQAVPPEVTEARGSQGQRGMSARQDPFFFQSTCPANL